jgi:hypothetical protein
MNGRSHPSMRISRKDAKNAKSIFPLRLCVPAPAVGQVLA